MGRSHWTPENLFGPAGKPLHYTGEISSVSLSRLLTPGELEDISSFGSIVRAG